VAMERCRAATTTGKLINTEPTFVVRGQASLAPAPGYPTRAPRLLPDYAKDFGEIGSTHRYTRRCGWPRAVAIWAVAVREGWHQRFAGSTPMRST
jgi:hypothetical protein